MRRIWGALTCAMVFVHGCAGAVGTVEATGPDAAPSASAWVPVASPTEYGGGDTTRGVPPSLEQRGTPPPK